MENLITHYILTFGSSSVILISGFLLLGIRIPDIEKFKKLYTAKKYLSLSYFILAVFGFISYFMQVEAEKDPVLMASTLYIASYQALLFTTASLVFIQAPSLKKLLIVPQLCIITAVGIPLVLCSLFSPDAFFLCFFYISLALYLFQMFYYSRLFRREYSKCLKQLEAYYDEEENDRLRWVKLCFYTALGIGVLAVFSIFCNTVLYDIFVVIYTVYYVYMVCRFYNYITDMGFLIPALSAVRVETAVFEVNEPGSNRVEEEREHLKEEERNNLTEEEKDNLAEKKEHLTEEEKDNLTEEEKDNLTEEEKDNLAEKEQQLKSALDRWIEEKRYCQGDVSLDDIACMLGTTRHFLRHYFRNHMPADFRTWRTELRVAEAKRIIQENPAISLEDVCQTTGFNHRANFHRQFQKTTGETPTEYKNRNHHLS